MFEHQSVLLQEAVDALHIKENGIYVDCTLGAGGHSSLILKQLKNGHLYCFDQDEHAIEASQEKLEMISGHFTIINANFRHIKTELYNRGVDKVDGILFDLGVSSPQFDDASRGFSYHQDARLDMRMNQKQELNAYDIVNNYDYQELVKILYEYGEERFAKNIARAIEKNRPIETTLQLQEIIKTAIPAKYRRKGHPAKKTFQAIRIEVNDELNAFKEALTDSLELLNKDGRIAVITFHSLEDRICKNIFQTYTKTPDIPKGIPVIPEQYLPQYKKITRKPIVASNKELEQNRRSRSAKLRVIERIDVK